MIRNNVEQDVLGVLTDSSLERLRNARYPFLLDIICGFVTFRMC